MLSLLQLFLSTTLAVVVMRSIMVTALRGRDSMPKRSLPLNMSRSTGAGLLPIPVRRPFAIGIWSALLVADAVLIARCLSGEWTTVVPSLLAVFSMVVVAAASHLGWLAFRADSLRAASNEISRWVPAGVSQVASVLWCVALATQSAPLTIGLLVGVALIQCLAVLATVLSELRGGIEASTVAAQFVIRTPTSGRRCPDDSTEIPPVIETQIRGSLAPEPTEFEAAEFGSAELKRADAETIEDEGVMQWMSRRMTDDGDVIEGWMRVLFLAGQREATVHVSFCPPLTGSPEIETEDIDGADLEIRVASAFPFGLRMTARRGGSTLGPHAARIGFVATAVANRRAA